MATTLCTWRRDRTTRCLSSLPINKRRDLLEDVPLVEAVGILETKNFRWRISTRFGNIMHNAQYTVFKIKPFGDIMYPIR